MKEYKAYVLGHVKSRNDLLCETAKNQAQQLANGDPIELWEGEGSRRIARFNRKHNQR